MPSSIEFDDKRNFNILGKVEIPVGLEGKKYIVFVQIPQGQRYTAFIKILDNKDNVDLHWQNYNRAKGLGLPVPAVFDTVTIDGRRGIFVSDLSKRGSICVLSTNNIHEIAADSISSEHYNLSRYGKDQVSALFNKVSNICIKVAKGGYTLSPTAYMFLLTKHDQSELDVVIADFGPMEFIRPERKNNLYLQNMIAASWGFTQIFGILPPLQHIESLTQDEIDLITTTCQVVLSQRSES